MVTKKRHTGGRFHIRNKYPVMVAVTFLVYIFAFVFMVSFAVMAGPSITAQGNTVATVPNVTGTQAQISYTTTNIENSYVNLGPLILVNNDNSCEIDGVNLTPLYENSNGTYMVADYDVSINSAVLQYVNNLFGDFHQLVVDNDIFVNSAYRSKEIQEGIYNTEMQSRADGEMANTGEEFVAKPGYSEHQAGYSFDLSLMDDDGVITQYAGEDKYSWINQNCSKYGFVVRYPETKAQVTGYGFEPWHFRYVGEPHAVYMTQNDLCLEEYITLIKTHTVDMPLYITDLSLNKWVVYYAPAESGNTTRISIPSDREYQISGNNVDGFIVTFKI